MRSNIPALIIHPHFAVLLLFAYRYRLNLTHHSGRSLREALCSQSMRYASMQQVQYLNSYGQIPAVLYQPSEDGRSHGNFIAASYRAILKNPDWRGRLSKCHTQKRCLPARDYDWHELDSCVSSDALLMNIFCYPGVTKNRNLSLLLKTEPEDVPEFGFMPRVPLIRNLMERTEVDMKLGNVLFEAKLTETDFQVQNADIVEQYRDLEEVFDIGQLPRRGSKYISYQLIRNVLAAFALNLDFCVLIDERRQDLLDQWFLICRAIRLQTLQLRCAVRTWQDLTPFLPSSLCRVLDLKYGIGRLRETEPD